MIVKLNVMKVRPILFALLCFSVPAPALAAGTDCALAELGHLPLTRVGDHFEAGLNVGYLARTAPAGSLACLTTVDLGTPPTVLGTWSPVDCADVRDIALYEGAEDTAYVAVIGRFLGANQPSEVGYYNQVIQVDVTDPANPITLSTTHVTEAGFTAVAYDDKGEVFAGSAYGFLAVDRGMAVTGGGCPSGIL